jgi:hypothetical protein
MKALSDVMYFGDLQHVDPRTSDTIFELMGQLSDEALRRIDLSLEGYREIEKRQREAEKAPHARKAEV